MSDYADWRFEVSSADPDATPVWVDLTSRVRTTGTGATPVRARRGGTSERSDSPPGTLNLIMENTDHALTPGNPSSPYPWWGQRRKCRLVEDANSVSYVRFTGYLRPVDMPDWAEPGVEQLVTVSAVDWLGRLDETPEFTGTLGEHIRTAGGTLVEHFPLDDPYPHASRLSLASLTRVVVGFDTGVATEPTELIQATAQAGPPGDDQSYARWQGISDGTVFLARARLESLVSIDVGATDVIAVSMWVYEQADQANYPFSYSLLSLLDATNAGIFISDNSVDGSLRATWREAVDTVVLSGRRIERDIWRLVTFRVNSATGGLELWSGADAEATGTAPVAPGAWSPNRIALGSIYVGAIGHVQIRVGPAASTMTRAMHLAQYAHGYRGLHRQSVADRIATLAGYAGVPAADLDLDPGASTPMQRARLARQRPATAMRAAADTDGGARLFAAGDGPLVLRPRQDRYGQAVTLQIPYEWLSRGLRFREDKPVNDVVASQPAGGQTRRTDAVSVQRYGVGPAPATLDTAIDADLGNYASWTVAAGATPRLRCPQLVVDLLPRTASQRSQLLALEIGDRIGLTGGPTTIPDEARHLIVEGLADEIGVRVRTLTLTTSPLLGPSAGVPPACPRVGDLVATTAIIAY